MIRAGRGVPGTPMGTDREVWTRGVRDGRFHTDTDTATEVSVPVSTSNAPVFSIIIRIPYVQILTYVRTLSVTDIQTDK